MKAELLMHERLMLSRRAFVEVVIWKLSKPLPDSGHLFKYRLGLHRKSTLCASLRQ